MTPLKSAQIKEIPLLYGMDTGAPEPHIQSQSGSVSVLYKTLESSMAKLKFNGCIHFSFGAPNDETLHGHPLWEAGLRFYGLFEVSIHP